MANPENKLPEIRGEAFTSARESLGLSVKDLSGMSCLSVRQIEQIENGESSSFYGAQVKFTAAKKVASLLKLQEELAFDFGVVASAKKSNPQEGAQESVVEEEKPKIPKPVLKAIKPTILQQNLGKSASQKNPRKKIFLLFGLAAVIVFSVINLRPLFFPEPVQEEVLVVEEVRPESPSADLPVDPKSTLAPTSPATSPATASTVPANTPAATVPAVSLECPPSDSSAVAYKTDAPKKAGDSVYLQSKTAQTVCVVDANGKTQNKTLEPGVGTSIYGKPPLKVFTSGQAQVDMYYQGVKVRLSNTAAKTIILEPTEIVQPVAPTDSQLR